MLGNLYSAVDRELEINEVAFEFTSLLLFRKSNSKFIYLLLFFFFEDNKGKVKYAISLCMGNFHIYR